MAVDPAVGLRHGDYFALWVGSVDSATQKIYTRELTLRHINVTAQVNQIVEAYLRWRPVQIQIEANGYQQTLARLVAERSVELGLVIPVSAVPSRGTKETRVLSSVPAYERGQFLLPPGLPPEIRAQFLNFPDGPHDDAPDVCAMGIELVGARRVREIQGLTAARRARQPASW
jgi:predicted phage terminase large subunit-like protein